LAEEEVIRKFEEEQQKQAELAKEKER